MHDLKAMPLAVALACYIILLTAVSYAIKHQFQTLPSPYR